MKMTWGRALPGEGSRRPGGGSARRRVLVVVAAGAAVVCGVADRGRGGARGRGAGGHGGGPVGQGGAGAGAGGVEQGRECPGHLTVVLGCEQLCRRGYYTDRRGHSQAFVVAERNGRWDRAVQVPGTAALSTGRNAGVVSLSCAPGGYCAAGGYYTDGSGHSQAFVVTRPKDRWRAAVEVPGSAALNTSGNAQVNSVSCPAAGECVAGGTYTPYQYAYVTPFVVSSTNGVWGTAATWASGAGKKTVRHLRPQRRARRRAAASHSATGLAAV
jgi:hypothetical protein